jgi:phasin
MIMAIPRKPKPSPASEPLVAIPDPDQAIAAAMAPVEAAPEILAATAPQPTEALAAAQATAGDFQALLKENTEKALAEAQATQERLRVAAEQGLEQTRAAYAKIKAAAEEATSTLETSYAAAAKAWGALHSKAIDVVKANADAHFDHVKAVLAAKSIPEVIGLHTEHLKARLQAANEQIQDLASTAQKAASDAGEPIKAILSKRFAA